MKDWKHPHWPLCNVVLPSLVAMNMDSIVMLTAQVLTQTSYVKLRQMIQEITNEETLPVNLRGFDKDGVYRASDYRTVHHLVSNEKERSEEERFDVAAKAFVLIKLLRDSRRYFIDEEGMPFIPQADDLALTGLTVMHHMMGLQCSTVALSELRIVPTNYDESRTSCIGCGVYPSIALSNHSCNPNSALYNHGKTVVMFSTRSVPKNSPISLSYVTQLRYTTTDVRQSILKENYYFSCTCEACMHDWFPDFERIFELKCVKCGNALDLKKGMCCNCQIYYRDGKDYKGEAPYNFFLVKDKLNQAASVCQKAKSRILRKGMCSEKDRADITNAIELMEKYVKEPCSMLLDAQEALRLSFLREGSWVNVKENTKGWFMGPAFLINSSLKGREEVHKDELEIQEGTPRRRGRTKTKEPAHSISIPPPPYIPALKPVGDYMEL